jgi:hypothetical protein
LPWSLVQSISRFDEKGDVRGTGRQSSWHGDTPEQWHDVVLGRRQPCFNAHKRNPSPWFRYSATQGLPLDTHRQCKTPSPTRSSIPWTASGDTAPRGPMFILRTKQSFRPRYLCSQKSSYSKLEVEVAMVMAMQPQSQPESKIRWPSSCDQPEPRTLCLDTVRVYVSFTESLPSKLPHQLISHSLQPETDIYGMLVSTISHFLWLAPIILQLQIRANGVVTVPRTALGSRFSSPAYQPSKHTIIDQSLSRN